MTKFFFVSNVFCIALVAACSSSPLATMDADDAQTTNDAHSGATSDSTSSQSADSQTADSGRVSYPGGNGSCAEMANYCLMVSAGDTDRVTLFRAYGSLCTTGNEQALQTALHCVADPSADAGLQTCWTFSDPNSATACLDANLPSSSALTGLMAAMDAKCNSDAGLSGTLEVIPYLLDATATALTTCIDAAADCDGANACFLNNTVTSHFVSVVNL